MSEEHWKLEKDLCRCCLSEGSFKNLAEPCAVPGVGNIEYSEMLLESLDVNITPVAGSLCASTFTICDECILRLQDACIFKRQVLTSEKRFRDLYSRNVFESHSKELAVKKEALDSDNEDAVKMELEPDDDDFRLEYDDHDDNKSDIELDLQAVKKAKTKKPKGKEKPKPKKRAVRPRKPAEAEPGTEAEGEAEPKAKKGKKNKMADYYTVRGAEYTCNDCARAFASQALVSQHYRFVHLKRRPKERKCPKCDLKVPAHQRAYHLERAHGITAPTCGICQKKFRYPCHLQEHQRKVHMNEKNASCAVCNKAFFDEATLRNHMVAHGTRRFECDLCGYQFRWKGSLKDHILAHMAEKGYVCKECGRGFVQKSTLRRHVKRVHFCDASKLC